MSEPVVMVVCKVCGKPLTDEESMDLGMGPICAANVANLAAAERLAEATVDTVPDGYIPLKQALALCSELGIPHGRLVRAMGSDRLIEQPERPEFFPAYVGTRRMRYLPKGCLEYIPDLLDTGNDAPIVRKPKPAPVPATEPEPAPTVEPEPVPATEEPVVTIGTSVVFEVVEEGYNTYDVGDITTVADFKRENPGLQLTRKRSKGVEWYERDGQPLLRRVN